jgi:hypothetical protein
MWFLRVGPSISPYIATPSIPYNTGHLGILGHGHSAGPSWIYKTAISQTRTLKYLWSPRDGNMQGFFDPFPNLDNSILCACMCLCGVLGIEPRPFHVLGNHTTT